MPRPTAAAAIIPPLVPIPFIGPSVGITALRGRLSLCHQFDRNETVADLGTLAEPPIKFK